MSGPTCCCGQKRELPGAQSAQASGTLDTHLTWKDTLGGWKVRWGIGRMTYGTNPGLYRIGHPGPDSPVLVTANYKLTVDTVRRSLVGMNVWLLVLDTKAVNVWCAAGKGTFGTEELIRRVQSSKLSSVVNHHDLVLPQLGAVGVAAHDVARATGFRVHYGPVRIQDVQAYLAAGMKATPAMRCVSFDWKERLVIAPIELRAMLVPTLYILEVLLVFHMLRYQAVTIGYVIDAVPFLVAVLTGGVLFPLLLPWIPSRAFALKGALLGTVTAAILVLLLPMGAAEAAGTAVLVLALISAMALGFTGASTFTTLAGVQLEVRWAWRPILALGAVGAALRTAAFFV